jgi:hypothetical protein
MRKLSEDRAAYEKEVEADRASFIAKTAKGLTVLLLQEGQKRLLAWLAEQLTREVFGLAAIETTKAAQVKAGAEIAAAQAPAAAATSITSFGAAAIVGGAAALAAITAILAVINGFETGGYTGVGNPADVAGVVHRDEFVFNAPSTRGNVQSMYTLMSLLERGVKLRDLMPGLQTGGYGADIYVPSTFSRIGSPAGPTIQVQGYDDTKRREQANKQHFEQMQEMRRQADRMQLPPVAIGGARARLIARAEQRDRRTSEITRPSLVVSTRRDR